MEIESTEGSIDDELSTVLFTGNEYTKPGSVVFNCLLLFGSNDGNCISCTKPCLHPLASEDLKAFFNVSLNLYLFICSTMEL